MTDGVKSMVKVSVAIDGITYESRILFDGANSPGEVRALLERMFMEAGRKTVERMFPTEKTNSIQVCTTT